MRVTVDATRDAGAVTALHVRFEPLLVGYHLYGTDLPRAGISGAGRPTLVELASTGWTTIGSLGADKPTHPLVLDGFDQAFPVYPDGPVVLTLPVRRRAGDTGGAALRVRITYMACSSSGVCLPPVEGRELVVPLN